jgi:hypothetical protein
MGDPEQMDLIEYLAGEAGRTSPQHSAFPGGAAEATQCVQNEHTQPASRIGSGRFDAKPNAAVAPMSPHRLLVCLAVIGWPERELARQTGRLQTTVRRWTGGRSPVPADVAAWVETLAALHRAHPAPRAGQGLPEQPAPRPL